MPRFEILAASFIPFLSLFRISIFGLAFLSFAFFAEDIPSLPFATL